MSQLQVMQETTGTLQLWMPAENYHHAVVVNQSNQTPIRSTFLEKPRGAPVTRRNL